MSEEPGTEGTHNLWQEKTDETEKEPKKVGGVKTFKRQLVLLDEVTNAQGNCFHALFLANSSTVVCVECGAVWIK